MPWGPATVADAIFTPVETMRHRYIFAAVMLSVAALTSAAHACVLAPPATPEEETARILRYQTDLWSRSQSVFLVRTDKPGRVKNGGLQATLVPILQLKGARTTEPLRVAHTQWTSCGPAPFFDALNGRSDEFFVAYSTDADPTESSVLATLRPSELIEPQAQAAWRAAYQGR